MALRELEDPLTRRRLRKLQPRSVLESRKVCYLLFAVINTDFFVVFSAFIVASSHHTESTSYYCTSECLDDGIIDPRDTRNVLGICLSLIHNKPVRGGGKFGLHRM